VPVQYPFGHGLSYTEFNYSDVQLEKANQNEAHIQVKITNTGTRGGKEIVQVYVGKKDSAVERPVKELKGFEKISLLSGESRLVTIKLDSQAFTYFDMTKQAFTIEPGQYEIYIGKSLTDIQAVLTCNL